MNSDGTVVVAYAPLVYNAYSSYTIAFVITDANGKTATSNLAISLTDSNKPPYFVASAGCTAAAGCTTALSAPAQLSVFEGSAGGSVIGQVFATDANLNQALTFGVASCAPAAANTSALCPFVVDSASGAVSVSLFASGALNALRRRLDPRAANGGIFLGLGGVVVKSHGGTDAIGFASALDMAITMAKADINSRITRDRASIGTVPA